MMTMQFQLEDILFFDIETVSLTKNLSELPEEHRQEWRLKSRFLLRKFDEEIGDDELEQVFEDRAAIFAEFGKIICISVGFVRNGSLRIKSFAGDNERDVLSAFSELLTAHFHDPARYALCGHNIKEFDIPYLCRRMLILGLALPPILDVSGKKPWETVHLLDTMEYWKFGDRKSYTSLHLLAVLFDIPTPKDDIQGKDVGKVYWVEEDLERIVEYCQKDVISVVQLFKKFSGEQLLEDSEINFTKTSKF